MHVQLVYRPGAQLVGQGNAHRPIVDTTPVLLELGYKQFEIEANGAHAGPERFETAVGDAEPEKAQRHEVEDPRHLRALKHAGSQNGCTLESRAVSQRRSGARLRSASARVRLGLIGIRLAHIDDDRGGRGCCSLRGSGSQPPGCGLQAISYRIPRHETSEEVP